MTMQTIRLECERRPDELTDLLEDYDNNRQYYLNGSRLSLEDSLKVRNHSPSGFFHGYGGSGPAQLALAICLQLYPQPVAEVVYQRFKGTYVATIPMEDEQFDLTLEVPSDPLAYWNMEPSPDWTTDYEAKPEPTRPNTEETLRNKALQQQHDQAYQEAILLPGSIPFKFTGLNNMPSFCYLHIIDNYQGKVVVIASDSGRHAENVGTSITNAAGLVASQVCREFKIPIDKLYWIERYVRASAIHPHGNAPNWNFEETWDRVTFSRQDNRLIAPQWQPLEREAVAQIKEYIFG